MRKKIIALSEDFNANPMHYDLARDVSDLSDLMYSNNLLPQITTLARITSKSATLIDNIFVNEYDSTFLSGNLTISRSDHLTQLLIMFSVKKKNELANNRPKPHRDMKNIDLKKDNSSTSLKNVFWDSKLAVNPNNANNFTELLLDSVNEVLTYYCHYKKFLIPKKRAKASHG